MNTLTPPQQLDPQTGLPCGSLPQPLPLPHFPTRFQAVIWRNWAQLTPARLARVLQADPSTIASHAKAMGLHESASLEMEKQWLARGYITLIRQNWQLLPYDQLLQLLDWQPAQLAFVLKEDDFLWSKLGRLKPRLDAVTCHPLDESQQRATTRLKQIVDGCPSIDDDSSSAQPFDFVNHLSTPSPTMAGPATGSSFDLRLAYSYYGIYGDPLMDAHADPYPDDMLTRLADHGINAIWFQAILYKLVPWLGDGQESAGHETRIDRLNRLIEKAGKYGICVYPYLNEPRGMPASFFEAHPQWRGQYYPITDLYSLCMSCPEIPRQLEEGARQLFEKAPGLAGAFTITMSENLTHCGSKPVTAEPCPRCASTQPHELVAQVNNTLARGIHRANPSARLIAWNWAWGKAWSKQVIDLLDPTITLMCTSETDLPTDTLGVPGQVIDYTLSRPGPGALAKDLWQHARARGMRVMAKVQLNNSWECAAVPYLPVPFLVKQHLEQLRACGITGLMTSWTLGGYPGGNLDLIDHDPQDIARSLYGQAAADTICTAWRLLGQAFAHFPLHGSATLYHAPQNFGPMNLLHATPTGYRASMLGFPQDDLDLWRGQHYPPDVFEKAFDLLSTSWASALQILKQARSLVPPDRQSLFIEHLRIAQAVYSHFRSTCLQIRFIRLRDQQAAPSFKQDMTTLLDEEIDLALSLRQLAACDSRIGYEASNHYFYTQATLLEKVVNCQSLKDHWKL